jgi:hypothetical protein
MEDINSLDWSADVCSWYCSLACMHKCAACGRGSYCDLCEKKHWILHKQQWPNPPEPDRFSFPKVVPEKLAPPTRSLTDSVMEESRVIRTNDVIDKQTFDGLTKLRQLTLRTHAHIDDSVLITMTRLERLALPYNSTISADAIARLPMLSALDLDNNYQVFFPLLVPLAPQLRELRINTRHLTNDEGKSSNALIELISERWAHVDILVHGSSGWGRLGNTYKRKTIVT